MATAVLIAGVVLCVLGALALFIAVGLSKIALDLILDEREWRRLGPAVHLSSAAMPPPSAPQRAAGGALDEEDHR